MDWSISPRSYTAKKTRMTRLSDLYSDLHWQTGLEDEFFQDMEMLDFFPEAREEIHQKTRVSSTSCKSLHESHLPTIILLVDPFEKMEIWTEIIFQERCLPEGCLPSHFELEFLKQIVKIWKEKCLQKGCLPSESDLDCLMQIMEIWGKITSCLREGCLSSHFELECLIDKIMDIWKEIISQERCLPERCLPSHFEWECLKQIMKIWKEIISQERCLPEGCLLSHSDLECIKQIMEIWKEIISLERCLPEGRLPSHSQLECLEQIMGIWKEIISQESILREGCLPSHSDLECLKQIMKIWKEIISQERCLPEECLPSHSVLECIKQIMTIWKKFPMQESFVQEWCFRIHSELECLEQMRTSTCSLNMLRERCLHLPRELDCLTKECSSYSELYSTLWKSLGLCQPQNLRWDALMFKIEELTLRVKLTVAAITEDVQSWRMKFLQIALYFAVLLCSLRLNITSGRNTRHVLEWSDKAVLLVLWTCGDVERNPGPANTKRLTRSEILRKFRRFTQMRLLEFIYGGRKMPKHPYSAPPPGWNDIGPDIEFRNISNTKSGEEDIFEKMLCLIKKEQILLPNDLTDALTNYNNLNARNNEEASKAAIELWILGKEIVQFLPKMSEYLEKTDMPHEEIQKVFQLYTWKFPLSLCDSDRSGPGDENWSEGNELPSCKAILGTNGTYNELPNFSTKKKHPVANSVEDTAEALGISETKRFKRNKDGPEKCITNEQQNQDLHGEYQPGSVNDTEGDLNSPPSLEIPIAKNMVQNLRIPDTEDELLKKKKRPVANSVEDTAEARGISETKRFKRNKDGPEKCITNEQQNQDLHGEYQPGSVNDTEGSLNSQPSLEIPTDENMVQNLRIPDTEDELLKKYKSNQQQSMDMHGEYQSLDSKGSVDDTARLVVVQSSMEVQTDGKTLDLLQSINDEDEDLWKGKDNVHGSEGITLMITDMYQVPLVSMFLRMYLKDKSIDHPSEEIVDLCLQILNRVFPQNS